MLKLSSNAIPEAAGHFEKSLPVKQRITLEEMLSALQKIEPKTKGIPLDERRLLHGILMHLSDNKGFRLPKDIPSNYDGYLHPKLPLWINRPAKQPEQKEKEKVVFVPELTGLNRFKTHSSWWVPVNEWLIKTRGQKLIDMPVKERSFEIFGDEKILEEKILSSKPVEKGCVDKSIFCVYPTREPIMYRDFGGSGSCIVIENRDTFHSFCLATERTETYRIVAYGCGNQFKASWEELEVLCQEKGCSHIEYFGDIDLKGIDIPFHVWQNIKLPFYLRSRYYEYIVAATNNGQAVCGSGSAKPCPDPEKYRPILPEAVQDDIKALLRAGRRIPQEALPYPEILRLLQ